MELFTQGSFVVMTVIILLLIWSIIWKGYALWFAARNSHKWWFIILLIVNTVGILEIIYIFAVAKKSGGETQSPTPTSPPQVS